MNNNKNMELETTNTPLISVIVPVYNAEKTLRQCVDSILSQNFGDYELLLVDDGSKDDSPLICDEYAEKDSRVKVFHKENGGVSAARNLGLDNAQGKWISFVDSDDYISASYFHGTECCNQQLLISGFRDEIDGKVYENVRISSAIYQDAEEVRRFIRGQVTSNMVLRGPVGKFYRHELIDSLRFNTDMKLGEDTCFVFDYLTKCKTIEVDESSYYVIRRGEILDAVKYKSSVDYAVQSLNFVWESYKNMEKVHRLGHGCFYTFIGYYKSMCKHEWSIHLASWYRNPLVYKMYRYVYQEIPKSITIKYYLIRFLSIFINKI